MNGLLIGLLIERTQNQLSRAVPVPGGAEGNNSKRPPGTQNGEFLYACAASRAVRARKQGRVCMCLDDHSCVFFEDGAESWPMCADSVAAAERAGFKWLVISERRAVGGYSLDTATLPATSISTASAFGMSETPFSINRVIGKIREQSEAAVAEGFAGLLLLIDMSWLLRTPSGIAQHGEFEAALQELVLGTLPLRAVCLYHLAMFPDWMVLDAMRTHPKVRTRDGEFDESSFPVATNLPERQRDRQSSRHGWVACGRLVWRRTLVRSRFGRKHPERWPHRHQMPPHDSPSSTILTPHKPNRTV